VNFLAIYLGNKVVADKEIHWYSDYPLALVLGYTFGMIVSQPEGITKFCLNAEENKLQIAPLLSNGFLGFNINYFL
jgi:hypothetical protein